jgi:hypothetical protein
MTAPAAVSVGCWTKARRLAVPGTLVKAKIAGVAIPGAPAVTWKDPTCEFATTETEATPVLSVIALAGPVNVTLGPLAGGVNVTTTPGTPLPSAS